MTGSVLLGLRTAYHRDICTDLLAEVTPKKVVAEEGARTKRRARTVYFNNADGDSPASVALAKGMAELIGPPYAPKAPSAQTSGSVFAKHTTKFLESSFSLLCHLRPGNWVFSVSQGMAGITAYDQYKHLADLAALAAIHPEIRTALGGDYLVLPDIIVGKAPVTDAEIDATNPVIGGSTSIATLTPFRAGNYPNPRNTLHASISCKWTMRSDRAQNTRTEALNLLRNRKGKSPQMIVVTAEPLPSRLVSIAIGTGDIDCTYHAALHELMATARANEGALRDQLNDLEMLVDGRRLRDISDLPFDLAI